MPGVGSLRHSSLHHNNTLFGLLFTYYVLHCLSFPFYSYTIYLFVFSFISCLASPIYSVSITIYSLLYIQNTLSRYHHIDWPKSNLVQVQVWVYGKPGPGPLGLVRFRFRLSSDYLVAKNDNFCF